MFNDRDRYYKDYKKNESDYRTAGISFEEYKSSREVDDYGLCSDELGTEDNEDYD